MSISITNDYGEVRFSPNAIAEIAEHVAKNCYGVVGLSRSKSIGSVIKNFLTKANPIEVRTVNGKLFIDMFIETSYGVNITSVCESIRHNVQFQLQHMTGCVIGGINVHVQNLVIK